LACTSEHIAKHNFDNRIIYHFHLYFLCYY